MVITLLSFYYSLFFNDSSSFFDIAKVWQIQKCARRAFEQNKVGEIVKTRF